METELLQEVAGLCSLCHCVHQSKDMSLDNTFCDCIRCRASRVHLRQVANIKNLNIKKGWGPSDPVEDIKNFHSEVMGKL